MLEHHVMQLLNRHPWKRLLYMYIMFFHDFTNIQQYISNYFCMLLLVSKPQFNPTRKSCKHTYKRVYRTEKIYLVSSNKRCNMNYTCIFRVKYTTLSVSYIYLLTGRDERRKWKSLRRLAHVHTIYLCFTYEVAFMYINRQWIAE